MKKILCMLPVIFILSCNNQKDGSSSKKKDPGGGTTSGQSATPVNLPDHSAYFNQFLFKKENVSEDPDFPETQFRFLMIGLPRIFKDEDGNKRSVTLEIGLFKNATFKSLYRENKFINDTNFFPAGCKEIAGTWKVIGDKIELVSNGIIFFVGERFFKDEKHMILFHIKEKILSELPANVERVDLSLGYTNTEYPEESLFKCNFFPF
ncbi:MAG: hypothetical protein QF441_13095 [Bacteriovoracaceae bacterium]|jgi:hypothetical protein|nr:hypothetical protein [Bacteriovoracaceae bacterium]